jgi:fatty acid desaturase
LRFTTTAALFVGGWVAFLAIGNSWWNILTAVYLAFAFTQIGFLGHDGGHRQAFRSRRWNDILMLTCANLGIGVASGWWFSNHIRHHAHPNNTALDPDVGLRYFAYDLSQTPTKAGVDRLVARFQHLLYFPLLCLLGFTLHVESVVMVVTKKVARPLLEGALLLAHLVAYAAVIATTLPPMKMLVFVLVHQMLFGLYLGSTFAPNHKGMEMYDGEEPSFLDRQVRSSRNVRGNAFTSYLLGGLNHQIEHHLFPSMPRPNLVRARPLVRSFCKEVGLPYAENSLWGSFTEVVRHFRSTRVTN